MNLVSSIINVVVDVTTSVLLQALNFRCELSVFQLLFTTRWHDIHILLLYLFIENFIVFFVFAGKEYERFFLNCA